MMITGEHPEKRRRAEPPPVATIPQDLLLSEVLPRLPAKHLARFKCVCRAWRAAVESDPAFVRRHLELSRAAPPSILVIPREEFYQDDDDDDDGDVEEDGASSEEISFHRLILGEAPAAAGTADVELVFEKAWPEGIAHGVLHPTHCDGLIAVATAADQVFVCNPATREFVALPPGSRDVLDVKAPAAALGYDPLRNRYVVARYFYRKYVPFKDVESGEVSLDHDIGHETFTLGGGGAGCWEPTADPPHAIGPARPVCTREAFYWCTAVRQPSALLRFGLRDRAFDVVPCPPGADYFHGVDHLTELAGKPCYVRPDTETAFDFWVADDDGGGLRRPEWTLRCRVDFADCGGLSVGSDALSVVAAAGDEMMISADHRNLYSCDGGRRRKGARLLVDMEQELAYERPDGSTYEGELLHHVVPYVESLVSIGKCNY